MNRGRRAALGGLAAMALVALSLFVTGVISWRRAEAELDSAANLLKDSVVQCAALQASRSSDAEIAPAARPQQDLIARVNRALDGAKVERRRFEGLSSGGDGAVPGAAASSLRQQSAVASFRSVDMGEVGKILAALREQAGAWSVSRIDLSRRDAAGEAGLRYDCSVTLVATYVSSNGQTTH